MSLLDDSETGRETKSDTTVPYCDSDDKAEDEAGSKEPGTLVPLTV